MFREEDLTKAYIATRKSNNIGSIHQRLWYKGYCLMDSFGESSSSLMEEIRDKLNFGEETEEMEVEAYDKFVWMDPPDPKTTMSKVDRTKERLKSKPGSWARIYSGPALISWWNPIREDREFEVKVVMQSSDELVKIFPPKDVFARYKGPLDEKTGGVDA